MCGTYYNIECLVGDTVIRVHITELRCESIGIEVVELSFARVSTSPSAPNPILPCQDMTCMCWWPGERRYTGSTPGRCSRAFRTLSRKVLMNHRSDLNLQNVLH